MVKKWGFSLGLLACSVALDAMAKTPNAATGKGAPAQNGVAALRAQGPAGLAAALRKYDQLQTDYLRLREESNRLNASGSDRHKETFSATDRQIAELERRIERVKAAIDQIGGQRSCTVSRLYWYTDLEEAKWAAEKTGRPVLSLRMLGKLTDEYSCANSRFFRTALYSNREISDYLRNHFVLHWQSVRPVPRVTIDFGDGRKLQRTLTGNSVHYVLAANGATLDALPGLYGPQRFLAWLTTMRALNADYAAEDPSQRQALLQQYHTGRRDALLEQWELDLQGLGGSQMTLVSSRIDGAIAAARAAGKEVLIDNGARDARRAARQAVAKSQAEVPLLRFAHLGGQWMEKGMDDDLWQAIANRYRDSAKMDQASTKLMRIEFPNADEAGRISVSKALQEDPLLRMVRAFELSMALDTVRNEYLLHRRIHEQFGTGAAITTDVDTLNEWVYAELFLTPSSDPWLGLAPPDVYTALEADGRVEPAVALASSGK